MTDYADFETVMVSKLQTDLESVVGSRIYPVQLPQGVKYPAIAYTRVDAVRVLTHDQTSAGLVASRFQFDIYGKTYGDVRAVSKALRQSLVGWQDLTLDPPVHSCLPALEQSSVVPDVPLYRMVVDYIFNHQES